MKDLLTSMILTAPAFVIFALAAHSAEITPQTQPDCSKIVCTQDGAELTQKPVIVLPTPSSDEEDHVFPTVAVPCKIDGKVIKGCWIK